MVDFSVIGVTQKIMSDLANVNAPAINKIVTSGNFSPLNKNASRNIKYSISDARKIIRKVLQKDFNDKPKIYSFYNFKGGVGKTTLCYEVSTHLAIMGFNVLVIDADPQGHLSSSLGFDTESNFLTLYDNIVGNIPIEEVVQEIYEGLDCIPSNISLSRLEPALSVLSKLDNPIEKAVECLKKKYDFIIFDTNPTISNLNRNITLSSDVLSIVVETQAYALNGLKILMGDLNKFCDEVDIVLPKITIVPNKYEDRTSSSGEAMTILRDLYGQFVIPEFAVRKSEELHTSCKNNTPLAFFCRSNSIALEDVRDLIHFFLKEKVKK